MRGGDVVRLKPTPEESAVWEWDSQLLNKYGMGPFLYYKKCKHPIYKAPHCFLATIDGELIVNCHDGDAATFEICDLIHDKFLSAVHKRRRHAQTR